MIYEILPVNNYQGNGSSTNFDFDFYIENESQLNVFLFNANGAKVQLEVNVDYSINELKNESGSYITFPLPSSKYGVLTSEQKISLELTLPISQETQYNNSSLLNLKALEYSLDYLTRLIQILARKITRCIKVEECSNNSPDELLDNINQAQINSQQYANTALAQANATAQMLELVTQNKTEVKELVESQLPVKNFFTNSILEAPNGVMSFMESTVTVKEGLRVLIPNGRNEDGTLKNIDLTLENDAIWTETFPENKDVFLGVKSNGELQAYENYFCQEQTPSKPHSLWYKPSENKTYANHGDGFNVDVNAIIIGKYHSNNTLITSISPYNACSFLKRTDLGEITSLAFPSNVFVSLPFNLNTDNSIEKQYIAIADGFFVLNININSGNRYVSIVNLSTGDKRFAWSGSSYVESSLNLPAKKGDKLIIRANKSSDVEIANYNFGVRFIYAKGVQ